MKQQPVKHVLMVSVLLELGVFQTLDRKQMQLSKLHVRGFQQHSD